MRNPSGSAAGGQRWGQHPAREAFGVSFTPLLHDLIGLTGRRRPSSAAQSRVARVKSPWFVAPNISRTTVTFSCDIAYSERPAAASAASLSENSSKRTIFPLRTV